MAQFVYWISLPLMASYFIWKGAFIKATPIWTLATASYLQVGSYNRSIAIGLLLSSFGDIFIEIHDNYKTDFDGFIPGLLCFLLAHLWYIYAFRGHLQSTTYKFALPLIIVYYSVVMTLLIPRLEADLKVPIVVYGLAISVMAFMSLNQYFTPTIDNTSKLLSLVGSISFVVSDTVLAFNKFYAPIPNQKLIVMVTYYLGQLLIAGSTQVGGYQHAKLKK